MLQHRISNLYFEDLSLAVEDLRDGSLSLNSTRNSRTCLNYLFRFISAFLKELNRMSGMTVGQSFLRAIMLLFLRDELVD